MKELKVIILQGIPASGKSTWARNEVKGKKDIVIVNRDSIRDSLGDYWVEERESLVSLIEIQSIEGALKKGFNVIIDATNLNPKTIQKWEGLVYMFNEAQKAENKYNAIIETKFFDVHLDEAIKRDKERERKVGESVIRDFYTRYISPIKAKLRNAPRFESNRFYREQDVTLPHVTSWDIDGTVALMHGRSPYDYSKVSEDKPNLPVINLLNNYIKGNKNKVIFVSGRSDECRKDTEDWLRRNISGLSSVSWRLFMREKGDYRKDTVVKEEIFNNEVFPYYNVEFHVDDRSKVVEKLREIGLLVLQVTNGDF